MTPWPVSVAFPLTMLGGALLIVLFDAAAAWLTREEPLIYKRLWPAQFVLFLFIGFVAMLTTLSLRDAQISGAVAGLAEGTLGWAITWRIGPGRTADRRPVSMAIAIWTITAIAFGLASIGALLFDLLVPVIIRMHG